jgi:hypothetical protein
VNDELSGTQREEVLTQSREERKGNDVCMVCVFACHMKLCEAGVKLSDEEKSFLKLR